MNSNPARAALHRLIRSVPELCSFQYHARSSRRYPTFVAVCFIVLLLSAKSWAYDPNWAAPSLTGWQNPDGTVTLQWGADPPPDPSKFMFGTWLYGTGLSGPTPLDFNTTGESAIDGQFVSSSDTSCTFPYHVTVSGKYYFAVRGIPTAPYWLGSHWSATIGIWLNAPPPTPIIAYPGMPFPPAISPPQIDATPISTPTPGGSSGPTSPDPVDVVKGSERDVATDMTVYNPHGPRVSFGREYRSESASAGYASPGLSTGWFHTYDYQVQGPTQSGTWGAVTLIYPNSAREALTPILDASGQPTGAFATPSGENYFVTGVPGSSIGQWQSFTMTWDDQSQWVFIPSNGSLAFPSYILSKITNRTGQSLNLNWDNSRKLTSIADGSTSTALLTLAYDTNGNLSSATDAYSRKVIYTFGPVTNINNPCLLSVSQVGDAATAQLPSHETYGYQSFYGQPFLTTVTVPSPTGTATSTSMVTYDGNGRVHSVTDANQNQSLYTYNVGNTLLTVKNAAGKSIFTQTYNFDAFNRSTGMTDAAGNSTHIEYGDANNASRPTRITDKNGHAVTLTYDAYGHVTTETSARSIRTTYTFAYDSFALGRLISVQEGTDQATPRTPVNFTYYEPTGLTHTLTGPAPGSTAGGATVTTTYTYDGLGNVLTENTPGNNATLANGSDQGITTTFNYMNDPGDTAHDVSTYSQPAAIGQPLTVTDNLGKVTHFRYGARGLLQSATDALGHEVVFGDSTASHAGGYNLADQPLLVTRPTTGQTGSGHAHTVNNYLYVGGPLTNTASYDESGSMIPFRQASTTYGLEGEVLSMTATDASHPATYTYDGLYRMKTFADGNGNVTRYFYSPVGYLASILYSADAQHPTGDTAQFPSHDPNGNILQRVDGRGVVTNYVYNDPESLLTDVQYPATPSLNVHYDYETYGRLQAVTDSAYGTFNANGTVNTQGKTFTYDDADLVTSIQTCFRTPAGTLLLAQTQSYLYWPNGSRQMATMPSGTFSYNYDKVGRLQTLTNPFCEATSWLYQDNGWLQSLTFGNGVSTAYSFDAGGELLDLSYQKVGTTLADFSVPATGGYDAAGNRLSVNVNLPLAGLPTGYSGPATYYSGTTSYQYDQRNQLLREQSTRLGTNPETPSYSYAYGYDLAGNPTTFRGAVVGSGSFNANNQSNLFGFAYDQNGNPISYDGLPLSFDAENHLLTSGH